MEDNQVGREGPNQTPRTPPTGSTHPVYPLKATTPATESECPSVDHGEALLKLMEETQLALAQTAAGQQHGITEGLYHQVCRKFGTFQLTTPVDQPKAAHHLQGLLSAVSSATGIHNAERMAREIISELVDSAQKVAAGTPANQPRTATPVMTALSKIHALNTPLAQSECVLDTPARLVDQQNLVGNPTAERLLKDPSTPSGKLPPSPATPSTVPVASAMNQPGSPDDCMDTGSDEARGAWSETRLTCKTKVVGEVSECEVDGDDEDGVILETPVKGGQRPSLEVPPTLVIKSHGASELSCGSVDQTVSVHASEQPHVGKETPSSGETNTDKENGRDGLMSHAALPDVSEQGETVLAQKNWQNLTEEVNNSIDTPVAQSATKPNVNKEGQTSVGGGGVERSVFAQRPPLAAHPRMSIELLGVDTSVSELNLMPGASPAMQSPTSANRHLPDLPLDHGRAGPSTQSQHARSHATPGQNRALRNGGAMRDSIDSVGFIPDFEMDTVQVLKQLEHGHSKGANRKLERQIRVLRKDLIQSRMENKMLKEVVNTQKFQLQEYKKDSEMMEKLDKDWSKWLSDEQVKDLKKDVEAANANAAAITNQLNLLNADYDKLKEELLRTRLQAAEMERELHQAHVCKRELQQKLGHSEDRKRELEREVEGWARKAARVEKKEAQSPTWNKVKKNPLVHRSPPSPQTPAKGVSSTNTGSPDRAHQIDRAVVNTANQKVGKTGSGSPKGVAKNVKLTKATTKQELSHREVVEKIDELNVTKKTTQKRVGSTIKQELSHREVVERIDGLNVMKKTPKGVGYTNKQELSHREVVERIEELNVTSKKKGTVKKDAVNGQSSNGQNGEEERRYIRPSSIRSRYYAQQSAQNSDQEKKTGSAYGRFRL